jgi:hypothetical protein
MGRRAEQLVWIDMGATSRQAALLSARGHRRIGIEEARAMLTATPLTMLMRRSWRSFRGEWRGARVEVPLMVTASPRPSPSGITSDARQSVMSVRRESGTIDGRPAIRPIGTVDATSVVLEENCS